MKSEQSRSEKFLKDDQKSKQIFIAGLFYVCLLMTVGAALLRIFGLHWFDSTVKIQDPPLTIQKIIKALLFLFEDLFVYKILTKHNWVLCFILSCGHLFISGFLNSGLSWLLDAAIMLIVALIFQRRWKAVFDFLFLYLLMTLYGAFVLFVKIGAVSVSDRLSFYSNVVTMIDYKLFIVTLYLFTKMKGGIAVWKTKLRLLEPKMK